MHTSEHHDRLYHEGRAARAAGEALDSDPNINPADRRAWAAGWLDKDDALRGVDGPRRAY